MSTRVPTGPIAAIGLVAGYGTAVGSGSRLLGGLVLTACGMVCVSIWARRETRRTTAMLTLSGLAAFALSHLLALAIGPWGAVLLVAAGMAGVCWAASDSRHLTALRPSAR